VTDDELREIEKRAGKAFSSPWTDGPSNFVSSSEGLVCEIVSGEDVNRDFILAARTDIPKLVVEVRRLRALLDRDRSGLAAALNAIRTEIRQREWLLEGRGPYEWNDDRYRQEAGQAMRACGDIATKALAESGRCAAEAFAGPPPVAERELETLRDALWHLMREQNGVPLGRNRARWEAAMAAGFEALAATAHVAALREGEAAEAKAATPKQPTHDFKDLLGLWPDGPTADEHGRWLRGEPDPARVLSDADVTVLARLVEKVELLEATYIHQYGEDRKANAVKDVIAAMDVARALLARLRGTAGANEAKED